VRSPSTIPSLRHLSAIYLTVAWLGLGFVPIRAESEKPAYPWKNQIKATVYSLDSLDAKLFYVALPFDDLAHPEMTKKWIPPSWGRPDRGEKPVSLCKDRWLQIKNEEGRSCYAQWEGSGPVNSNDAEYVFGAALPKASLGAKISPQVALYLGIDPRHSRISWRFVDAENVEPGLWLTYSEQAILIDALKKIGQGSVRGSSGSSTEK